MKIERIILHWKKKHTRTKVVCITGTDMISGQPISEEMEIVSYDKVLQLYNTLDFWIRRVLRKPKIKTVTRIIQVESDEE